MASTQYQMLGMVMTSTATRFREVVHPSVPQKMQRKWLNPSAFLRHRTYSKVITKTCIMIWYRGSNCKTCTCPNVEQVDVSEIWYEKMIFWIPENMIHFLVVKNNNVGNLYHFLVYQKKTSAVPSDFDRSCFAVPRCRDGTWCWYSHHAAHHCLLVRYDCDGAGGEGLGLKTGRPMLLLSICWFWKVSDRNTYWLLMRIHHHSSWSANRYMIMFVEYDSWIDIPSRELTYLTNGKGDASSQLPLKGDMCSFPGGYWYYCFYIP